MTETKPQPKEIFRKVSLDRLASPEQLDQLMRVTDSNGWIALAALAMILAVVVVWGVVGNVPQTVAGTGILVRSGGVFEVVPLAGGRISDVAVDVGDIVHEGQVVARLSQPELTDRLQQLKTSLGNLKERHSQLAAHNERDLALQASYLAQQRTTTEQAAAAAEQNFRWWSERTVIQEKLAAEGLITRQAVVATRQQQDAARQRLNESRAQIAQLAVRELDVRNDRQTELRASEMKIHEQEQTIAELMQEIKTKSEVTAPCAGRVLEVMTEEGALVARGEPMLTLDRVGRAVKDLEAVIYVPSVYGKQIRPGMSVLVAPSTVKQQEYGLMHATVTYVSGFPATAKGMQRVLKNEKLVAGLARGDAPYEIRADLVVDPETPSRYKWSSSSGPPLRIQSGTIATGKIVVATKRPVEMVIPWVREHAGL